MAAEVERMDPTRVGPLGVSLLVLEGAPMARSFADNLRREVIDVELAGADVLAGAPDPERPVAIVWVPAGTSTETFENIVDWSSRSDQPMALLGCGIDATGLDTEHALAAGFDDFVAGRVSAREIAARIRALHRRIRSASLRRRSRQRFGKLVLDSFGYQLWVDGRRVPLTSTELAVMGALINARGQALSRAEILDAAWGENLEVGERAVDNVILRLRRKLGDANVIETVRGVGFRVAQG